jgi:hypothetical protein
MPSKMGSGAQVLTSGTNVPFGLMRIRIPIFTRALFSFLSKDTGLRKALCSSARRLF